MENIRVIVKRCKNQDSESYYESFDVPHRPNMNIISVLMSIQENPFNISQEMVEPVCWECSCLEEVCGACSMIINGKPRQACTALVDELKQPITLEPLSTFPIIKDLKVDRSRMFEALKKVKAWIEMDGTYDIGSGQRFSEKTRALAYELSKCMTCGICLEVCPNVNSASKFMGAAPISQVRLFNSHPTGAMNKEERLEALMESDGIQGCGNSQNCKVACPKCIPLTTSIGAVNREITIHNLKKFFG